MLYERIMENLKTHRDEVEHLLVQGLAENFEHYRYMTGRLKGLEEALEIFRETFKRGDDVPKR